MINARIVSLIIYMLILAGIFTRNPLLLATAFPFILYLLPGLFGTPSKVRLSLTRQLSASRALQGEQIEIKIRMTNQGSTRLEEIHIEDQLPGNPEIMEGEAYTFGSLEKNESIEFNYTIKATRGDYRFDRVTVTVNDHFAIFQQTVSLSDPKNLLVLPNVRRLAKIPLQLRRPLLRPGLNLARIGGAGTQFFEVREYQPGDALRHINWQAFAKKPDSFFTNVFEQERVADIGLILDEREMNYPRHPQSKYLGYAVDATAILADTLLTAGNRVGMLIYGTVVNWTFPGYGKYQREKIFNTLSKAKEGSHQVFEKMENIPTRYFPPKSQIILISPIRLKDISALIQLRARGYELILVMPDFTFIVLEENPDIPYQSRVKRIAKIEQKLMIQKLEQHGIFVIDWDVTISFEQIIHTQIARFQIWQQHRRWA